MGKAKKIGIGVGIAVLGFIIFAATMGSMMIAEENQEINSMPDSELEKISVNWFYPDLLRNIDNYAGNIIHFSGTVEVPSEDGVFGIFTGKSKVLKAIEGDLIFVEYDKKQFLINDKVEGFGYVVGLRNMEWTPRFGGATITEEVPNLEAIRVTCTSC